jgi:cytoskeletal protein RodZ
MYTQKKPIDNTHIVRERDRRRNRELLAVLSLGVPIGLFLLLFTWQNLEVIRLGREATRLQKTLKETETEHKTLEAELDRMTSFLTVEEQAVKMGFAPTDPKTIVMVEKSGEGSGALKAEALPVPVSAAEAAAAPQDAVDPEAPANRQPPTANSSANSAAPGGR